MKSKLLNIVPVVIFSAVLFGCSDGSESKEEKKSEDTTEVNVKEEKAETTEEATESEPEKVAEDLTEEQLTINTDVFEYATKTEVTNAIDINDHVTVFVYMSEDLKPGLAAQHVLNQTYDFIQQDDVKDAKTITIAVSQNDIKTFQFTVDKSKFKSNDEIAMSELVLVASKVETISPEVKEFAETLDWKIKE